MKPCSPQGWSNRRAAVGLVLLAALAIGSALATGSLWITLCAATFYVLGDWILLRLGTRRPTVESVTLAVRSAGEAEVLMAGSTIRLTATLSCRRRAVGCLIVPLTPGGCAPAQPPAYCGGLRSDDDQTLNFHLRIPSAGLRVFPGVVVRLASPFRLFSRSHLVTDRMAVTVLPNYRDESSTIVARFLSPLRHAGLLRRHVMRGLGTDFHELREFRPSDSRGRVDWKATARRGELIVREFEEPRDFEIQVVLDASLSMCFGVQEQPAYANASEFVARLAFVALAQGITFRLHLYNDGGVDSRTMRGSISGLVRLLTDLAWLPRRGLRAAMDRGGTPLIDSLAVEAWRRAVRNWSADLIAPTLDEFCERYFDRTVHPNHRRAEFIADFSPHLAVNVLAACSACGEPVFAEEAVCGHCGAQLARNGLSPRTEAACAALGAALRHSRSRQMLLFVSALGGGEPCEALARMLLHAHSPYRTVHLAVPNVRELKDARPLSPESLGNVPTREEALRNVHQLQFAAAFASFRRRLEAGGVQLHSIEDRSELDSVVADLLLTEIRAA